MQSIQVPEFSISVPQLVEPPLARQSSSSSSRTLPNLPLPQLPPGARPPNSTVVTQHPRPPSVANPSTLLRVEEPAAAAPTSVTEEQQPYPRVDPYVEALQHTVSLQQLCSRCNDDKLRTLYLGQLVTAVTQLLRKARVLDALSTREELEQLQDLLN